MVWLELGGLLWMVKSEWGIIKSLVIGFLLANLNGFDPDQHMVDKDELLALDRWVVAETLTANGVEFHTGAAVESANSGKHGQVTSVATDQGRFKADLVIVAAGVAALAADLEAAGELDAAGEIRELGLEDVARPVEDQRARGRTVDRPGQDIPPEDRRSERARPGHGPGAAEMPPSSLSRQNTVRSTCW
mgnify:CR=1 FL=1